MMCRDNPQIAATSMHSLLQQRRNATPIPMLLCLAQTTVRITPICPSSPPICTIYALETISIFGLNCPDKSSRLATNSFGILLTLYAPSLTAWCCIAEMPLRLLLMLPASLPPPIIAGSRILLGGAKSNAVNVPLFRRSCGDGRTANASKEDARGVKARTDGEYGLAVPKGESGRAPFWTFRMEDGGAKSMGLEIQTSWPSL